MANADDWQDVPLDDWQDIQVETSEPESRAARALGEGFAQGMTFGHKNELGALLEKPLAAGYNALVSTDVGANLFDVPKGATVKPRDYIEARDAGYALDRKLQESNPGAFIGGNIVGGLVPAIATMGGSTAASAGGAAATIGKGALTGAAYGGLTNPGAREGEIDPLQIGDRMKGVAIGGVIGGAIPAVGVGLSRGSKAVGGKLKDFAEERAVKAAGAMKRDFDKLQQTGKVSELGRTLLDEDIVTPFARPKDIAARIGPKIDESVDDVAKYISQADDILSNPGALNMENATPQGIRLASNSNLTTDSIKERLVKEIRSRYPGVPEEELAPALSKIETWFAGRPSEMTARELQDLKVGLNQFLRDSDFYKEMPGMAKQGLMAVRRGAKEAIEKKGDAAAAVLGDSSGQIKNANRRLGNLMELQDIAEDGIARANSNRAISLTDTIAGASGMGAGALAGGPAAIVGGLASAGANKFARTYGASLSATGADALAKQLTAMSPRFAKMAQSNPAAFAALVQGLQGSGKFKESLAPQVPQKPLIDRLTDDPRIDEQLKSPRLREVLKKRREARPEESFIEGN